MQALLKLIRGAFIFLLLINCPSPAQAQSNIVVDRNGSAAPDGSSERPYQLVEAGACKARPNGTVEIRPGVYNETFTLDYPVRLTASGPALIGPVGGQPRVTLKVVTYNTHLFGDEVGGILRFADRARAASIADWIRLEDADVVGLQEVWDEELAAAIIQRAGYPHSFYSNEHDESDDLLNSGLLLLSKHPLLNATQTFYRAEVSISDCGAFSPLCLLRNPTAPWKCLTECTRYIDGFASKGFVQATVNKDGFQLGIFITHTQAEHHIDAKKERRKQLEQLGPQIQQYRAANPGAEVIALGDFNVISESGEYYNSLLPLLGLRDAFANRAPCLDTTKHRATCDYNQNDLARHFDNTADDCNDKRLDYVLYSHGNAFDVLPAKLEVRRYQAETSDQGKTVKDLSDHYGIAVELSLGRRN